MTESKSWPWTNQKRVGDSMVRRNSKPFDTSRASYRSGNWNWLWLGLWLVCRSSVGLELFDGLQVHGFLSQGYFKTSANRLFGKSDNTGSLDFTELAINASWSPLPRLQLSTQLLSRRAGKGHNGEIELDFGLLDYSFVATAERRVGIRLGRVRWPFGLYNDTRDVPFARPSILLPQSIYFDADRELNLSLDGGMLYGEHRGNRGSFFLEFGAVLPRVDNVDTELTIFGQEVPGHLAPTLSYVGRLVYEYDQGRIRLAVSGAHLEDDYRPGLSSDQDLTAGNDLFQAFLFSAQYNTEHWSFTSEYARRRVKDTGFGPRFPDFDVVGESYYGQVTYRHDSHWETVLRYDVLYPNRDDRDGLKFKAATGLPAHLQFAKDWMVGVRYNITPSWMVRAEYHNVYGFAWLFTRDNPDPAATEKKWDIFALLLSYRF